MQMARGHPDFITSAGDLGVRESFQERLDSAQSDFDQSHRASVR